MNDEVFTTKNYLINLRNEILLLNKEVVQNLEGGDHIKALLRNCDSCLEIASTYFVKNLGKMNENPFWSGFFRDWKPNFDTKDLQQDLFLTLALVEIVLNQVNLEGVYSTKMSTFFANINEAKDLYVDNGYAKEKYEQCKDDYFSVAIFSILKWGILRDFEVGNAANLSSALKDLNEEKQAISEEFSSLDKSAKEIEKQIKAMNEKAGFLSLYAGFDKYAEVIKKKIFWLTVERIIWVVLISVSILFGLFLKVFYSAEWPALIPLVGMILLCSTLLRVTLKKTDQYEQIMSKVEHKLAVSTFYQSELKGLDEGDSKIMINNEYYKFLFSDIETTEWNTPDVVSDIASILKSYKK